jgi:hypothetical protein
MRIYIVSLMGGAYYENKENVINDTMRYDCTVSHNAITNNAILL